MARFDMYPLQAYNLPRLPARIARRMNVTVVIPTYNERDNLPVLIPDVLGQGDYRVLVVDDDSPDGTGAVADSLAREHPGRVEVLHRRGRRGLGRSSSSGAGKATRRSR